MLSLEKWDSDEKRLKPDCVEDGALKGRYRCQPEPFGKQVQMKVDLFIRSYDGDAEWLQYCLRSIQRFATGFRRTVVVVPNGHTPPTGDVETVFHVAEVGDQYCQQQSDKMQADHFSDADFITFTDSDTVFTRPVTPNDLICPSGKVGWLYTPYASLGEQGSTWKRITEKMMKRPVEMEMMRRHPFTAPRWALQEFRAWVHRTHGISMERYFLTQLNRECSEFNFLGAYLWFHHRDKVEWQNTDENMGTTFCLQHYSWGGLTEEIRSKLELAVA